MSSLDARLTGILTSRAKRQILRSLTPNQATQQPLVDFSSNDYLSFARSPALRQKFLATLQTLPSPYGPPSSRLLDGNSSHHLALEAQLSAFFCAEASLLFNSGFDANVGAWTVLPDKNDWIVYDELIHASVHDGMRAARVEKSKRRSFKHNDVQDLQQVLEQIRQADDGVQKGERNVWVGVETLYSMDGDLSPLKEIVELVEYMLPKGNGHMVVDEVSTELCTSASSFELTLVLLVGALDRPLWKSRPRGRLRSRLGQSHYCSCAHLRKSYGVQRWSVARLLARRSEADPLPSRSRRPLQPSHPFVSGQLRPTAHLFDRHASHERHCHQDGIRHARGRPRRCGEQPSWKSRVRSADGFSCFY